MNRWIKAFFQQFFIDYNLYGMDFILFNNASLRDPTDNPTTTANNQMSKYDNSSNWKQREIQ